MTTAQRAAGWRFVVGIGMLAFFLPLSCIHVPMEEPYDSALSVRIDGLAPDLLPERLHVEELESDGEVVRYRLEFELAGHGEPATVRGEYLRLAGASAETPAPLLQISPILGGALNDYLLARVIAGWAADAGFSCFFIYQPEEILDAHVDGAGMTRLLRRTTAENLAAIRLLCARPEVDAARIGSFGVSLGAIKNVLLLAAEPRIAGGVLCLPGGDLARILALSRETLVERYFENRSEASGLDRAAIVAELREHLAIEPLAVAPAVGAERVLLFLGSLDDKVPYATGLALYQGLGRPELHVFPVGHYTGMVTAPRAAALGFVWLKERFATLAGEGADP